MSLAIPWFGRRGDRAPYVELMPREQLQHELAVTVKATGFTEDELAEQAQQGLFVSHEAQLAWDLLKDVRYLETG